MQFSANGQIGEIAKQSSALPFNTVSYSVRISSLSSAHTQAALSQFMSQRDFINCFQQTRSKMSVNLVGGDHNLSCDLVGCHDSDFLAQSRGGRRERQRKI
jgi:hypothetical protein